MNEFDFIEAKPKKRFRLGAAFLNLISLGVVLTTLAAAVYFVLIYLYPFSNINPLPPAPIVENIVEASPTMELPSPTEEPTATATSTETPEPTATHTATQTPLPGSPTPTATRVPGSYYEIQDGSPAYLASAIFHPDLKCEFLGVVGQAFGLDDTPIPGLFVQITGLLDGEDIEKVALTGAATHYGSGAYYELQLSNVPVEAPGLMITLVLESGEAISDPFEFDAFSSCDQNLVLINFKALP